MAHDKDEQSYSASTPHSSHEYFSDPRQYQAPPPPPPPPPNGAPSYQSDQEHTRSRASSNAARQAPDSFKQQPVYDAVNDAFGNSSAAAQVPNELIRQITEQVRSQVIHSLKAEGFAAQPPASAPPQTQHTFPPPPTAIPRKQTPPPVANGPANGLPRRNNPTPPIPVRRDSTESEPPAQDPYFNHFDGDSKSDTNNKKEEMSSRYGDRSQSSLPRRPTIPAMESDLEPTTLEKIWQPLFNVHGEPTPRLGQFLRGIALHIIEDYEPKNSLVITPVKLKTFYEDVKLQEETYPWHNIFRLSHSQIGKIYRDMKCAHFYVQERDTDVPSIPALTPHGFQRWMTLHIQAHPQAEFERLAQAVRDMPINNADDRKERFPKELSRRLLPKNDDLKTRQYCSAALSADGNISLPKHTSFPPPPPSGAPSSQTSSSFGDRERKPYGSMASAGPSAPIHDSADVSSASDDEHSNAHRPVQIERERKPYTAKEGSGKIYHNENSSTSSRTLKPDSAPPSATASNKHRPSSAFIERDLGNHSDSSRNSEYTTAKSETGLHRSRTYSKSSTRRPRSPLNGGFVRSDSSVTDIPPGYYTSNVYGERDEDRYRDRESRDRRGERDEGGRDQRERERRDRDDRDKRDREDREKRDREDRDRRDREDRDRERDRREREDMEREKREWEERARENEMRYARYDGEPISRRTTIESGYPNVNVGSYSVNGGYGQSSLGTGERRYG